MWNGLEEISSRSRITALLYYRNYVGITRRSRSVYGCESKMASTQGVECYNIKYLFILRVRVQEMVSK